MTKLLKDGSVKIVTGQERIDMLLAAGWSYEDKDVVVEDDEKEEPKRRTRAPKAKD
jgi:hypothetical protein